MTEIDYPHCMKDVCEHINKLEKRMDDQHILPECKVHFENGERAFERADEKMGKILDAVEKINKCLLGNGTTGMTTRVALAEQELSCLKTENHSMRKRWWASVIAGIMMLSGLAVKIIFFR